MPLHDELQHAPDGCVPNHEAGQEIIGYPSYREATASTTATDSRVGVSVMSVSEVMSHGHVRERFPWRTAVAAFFVGVSMGGFVLVGVATTNGRPQEHARAWLAARLRSIAGTSTEPHVHSVAAASVEAKDHLSPSPSWANAEPPSAHRSTESETSALARDMSAPRSHSAPSPSDFGRKLASPSGLPVTSAPLGDLNPNARSRGEPQYERKAPMSRSTAGESQEVRKGKAPNTKGAPVDGKLLVRFGDEA